MRSIDPVHLSDEPLVQSFARPHDLHDYTDQQLLDFCKSQCASLLEKSEHILNAVVLLSSVEVSKLFVSANRELDQNYAWINGNMVIVYKNNGKVVQSREGA